MNKRKQNMVVAYRLPWHTIRYRRRTLFTYVHGLKNNTTIIAEQNAKSMIALHDSGPFAQDDKKKNNNVSSFLFLPVSNPHTAITPKKVPATRGASITSAPGGTMYLRAARVEMAMHRW